MYRRVEQILIVFAICKSAPISSAKIINNPDHCIVAIAAYLLARVFVCLSVYPYVFFPFLVACLFDCQSGLIQLPKSTRVSLCPDIQPFCRA